MSETKHIIGEITAKQIKTGEKNEKPWRMAIFTIGKDFKVSTFHQDTIDGYNTGVVVKAEYTTDGKYNNLVGFDVPSTDEMKQDPLKSEKPDQQVWIDKDVRIVRQNCNQRAIETLRLINDIKPEKIIELLANNDGNFLTVVDVIASHFEQRVWRDL